MNNKQHFVFMIRDCDNAMGHFNFRLKHNHRGIRQREIPDPFPRVWRVIPKKQYMYELLIPGFGRCYCQSLKHLSPSERVIRMRFRKRHKAFTGWDPDKGRFVVKSRKRPAGFYRQNPEFVIYGF